MRFFFEEKHKELQSKIEKAKEILKIGKLLIKYMETIEDLKVRATVAQLEKELVGPDKLYPTEEALYDFDYNTNQNLYKPEVFVRYTEIYNSLSNE